MMIWEKNGQVFQGWNGSVGWIQFAMPLHEYKCPTCEEKCECLDLPWFSEQLHIVDEQAAFWR